MTAPDKKEKLHKILDLILDINCFENKDGIDDNKPKTMFEFMGHANSISIRVFAEGWSPEKKPDIRHVVLGIDENLNKVITELETMKDALRQGYPAECTQCGEIHIREDMLQTIQGDICEECLGD